MELETGVCPRFQRNGGLSPVWIPVKQSAKEFAAIVRLAPVAQLTTKKWATAKPGSDPGFRKMVV
jgi:hypothetical protein